jgi:hypothetical protein
VELFEEIRRGYSAGETVKGLAKKLLPPEWTRVATDGKDFRPTKAVGRRNCAIRASGLCPTICRREDGRRQRRFSRGYVR